MTAPPEDQNRFVSLAFPKEMLEWPVPKAVFDAVARYSYENYERGLTHGTAAAVARVQNLHQPYYVEQEDDEEGDICRECERLYPCDTMKAVMGIPIKDEGGDESMTESPDREQGINIETKEGGIVHTMKPSDEGTPNEGDSDSRSSDGKDEQTH